MPPDKPLIPAPDTLGGKNSHPIAAQPLARLLNLKLSEPARIASGLEAVLATAAFSWGAAGVGRGTRALTKLNLFDGYDCTSCAWPDPDEHRSVAESRGNTVTYYPETNVLVPLSSVVNTSNTPTSKTIIVTVAKVAAPVAEAARLEAGPA